MIDELNKYWNQAFPAVRPEADAFKGAFRSRWVRFHSLPESKRYAENEAEYQELLSRHNVVVSELAHEGTLLYLVATEYSGEEQHKSLPEALAKLMPEGRFWNTFATHEPNAPKEDWSFWHQYACAVAWSPGVLDKIFRLAADDATRNVMLISTADNWLYHPYDGGADVILSSEQERDALMARHRNWLSTCPSGL